MVSAGVAGLAATAVAIMLAALMGAAHVWIVAPLVSATIVCFGLIGPSANHEALSGLPEVAGLASGVLRCTQMVLGAFASGCVAWLQQFTDPLTAMAGLILAAAGVALMAMLWLRAAGGRPPVLGTATGRH